MKSRRGGNNGLKEQQGPGAALCVKVAAGRYLGAISETSGETLDPGSWLE